MFRLHAALIYVASLDFIALWRIIMTASNNVFANLSLCRISEVDQFIFMLRQYDK